ncbi:MAG: choice-of-anchor D domain-containing protein [Verrucomicrobiaceae bacterium]|nr:choice-of-anchor D domain-containing protein [Verrucomicrobiaceae bacterium]
MKTNPSLPPLFIADRPAHTMRLIPLFFLVAFALAPAYAANTFIFTGSLATERGGHTATLLPSGKVLVLGGGNFSGSSFTSAELYDPTTGAWTAASPPASAFGYSYHTATSLPNGKVLFAGRWDAELYDPNAGTWATTGFLITGREKHTATLLPNGKVLVVGGRTSPSDFEASAEIYDPATGTWSATGSLSTPRFTHTATLLPNGKVLVAGGKSNDFTQLSTCELYDPATGLWSSTGAVTGARGGHTATLLTNGKVLVAGGGGDGGFDSLTSAQLYDPATGTWSATGSFTTARGFHTATLLPNGKVLVTGGLYDPTGPFSVTVLDSAELYDPAAGTWTVTDAMGIPPPSLPSNRYYHTATLLPSGKALVIGGFGNGSVVQTSTELFDSANGAWSSTGSMSAARSSHSATLLPNGRVLVAGGSSLASAQVFNPTAGTWANTGAMAAGRGGHTATLLTNGKVLVTGGSGSSGQLSSSEIYDYVAGTWVSGGAMTTPRDGHAASLLPDGRVLIVGGGTGAEVFDSTTTSWAATAAPSVTRSLHTATLLPNGKVLVVGGDGAGGPFSSCELFDPSTGTWSTTGSLAAARYLHSATLLPNGKVLIAGGRNSTTHLASAELYDSATGVWTSAGSMTTARNVPATVLLRDGRVLVAGGNNSGSLSSTEVYDTATGTWTATASLGTARAGPTCTLLPNGKILAAGGSTSIPSSLASAELFDPGLGYTVAVQPVISSASFAAGKLTLTGTGFRGVSSASGGNGSQDSPTNYPVVQLRRLDNGQCVFLQSDPTTSVSATAFTSVLVTTLPQGYALATVHANGIPSASTIVLMPGPQPDITLEQPAGSVLVDGTSTVNFGSSLATWGYVSRTFTLRNDGPGSLTGLSASIDGVGSLAFSISGFTATSLAPGASTTFTVNFGFGGATAGAKTAQLHIASNDPDEAPFDVNLTGTILASATMSVEQPAGTPLGSGGSVSFGGVLTGSPVQKTITIKNANFFPLTSPLTITSITRSGGNVSDFAIGTPGSTTVMPGGSTTFTVTFTPSASGARTTTLSIASNDGQFYYTPFTLTLTGTGLTVQESWRQTWFGSAGNTGNAADDADPDHDGMVNILEFYTGANPTTSSPVTGALSPNGSVIEFVYTRATAALGLSGDYQFFHNATFSDGLIWVEWSDDLSSSSWVPSWSTAGFTDTILSDNGTVQTVKATLPAGTAGHRFVRLRQYPLDTAP